jgi:two-component system NtrC family sensor kinase
MESLNVRWWNRLGIKLAAAITLVSVATLGIFVTATLRSQRRHLLEQARIAAATVSDTVTNSLEHDMLQDRRDDAYRIMSAIGQQDHIAQLRVFDRNGEVRWSKQGSEIGHRPDIRAEACEPCHGNSQSSVATLTLNQRTRIYEHQGRRLLGAITPIYNQQSCATASCHVHPASQRVLGVVELGLELKDVEAEMAQLDRTIIGLSVLAALALAGLTFLFMRHLVVRPVKELVKETRRLARREARGVRVRGSGEIAALASAFNQMESAMDAAHAERDQLLATLEAQVKDRTAALERAQDKLVQTEKLSSLGRLSASIAHEINNPLAGILTYAKLIIRTLQEGVPDDTVRKRLLTNLALVERETQRCTAIVRNLLDFARERPMKVVEVDLAAVIEEALFLVSNQIALQNVRLERDLQPVPPVPADFGQIRQAIVNILVNACDAMPQGGVLTVTTRVVPDGDRAEIRISDTGVGIPKDKLSKVLDPFFTTKDKGTGLGLSVVYGIVQRHGGALSIDSEPGRGTTVSIALPLVAVAAVAT